MRKKCCLLLVVVLAIVLIGCGSSNDNNDNNEAKETAPSKKEYIDESEIDDALSDGEAYKGKWIVITGKVFNVDKDGSSMALQAYYDVEDYDQPFIVYVEKNKVDSVKQDDYIKVDGQIAGKFEGENFIGGEISNLLINADSIEVGTYDTIAAPPETTLDVNQTIDQSGLALTITKVEFSKKDTRVYITANNSSGYNASIYTGSAKAIQDGQQFEYEYNYEVEDQSIDELLAGASKDGVIRFKPLDPGKPLQIIIEAYSDNYDIEMNDFVFDISQ